MESHESNQIKNKKKEGKKSWKSKMLFENNKVKKKRRKKRKKPRQFSVEIDTSMHFMYYNAQNALNK